MPKFEIKCRFTAKILFEIETDSMRLAVEAAVNARADLTGADLARANLTGADLTGAYLTDAYLADANLTGADLTGANLTGADLTGAYLARANLTDANLARANLTDTKKDFIRVISAMKTEIAGLFKAMWDGKIDGSKYSGECACLKGTLANVKGCGVGALGDFGLACNSDEPSEKWFMAIRIGDNPENNRVSKLTVAWIEEFCKEQNIQLPTRSVVWRGRSELSKRKA